MGNRTAKFLSTLVASIIAGAPLAAVSQNAPSTPSTANAAGDCLASPKGSAPQGQHWHYRLERSTKRQCWYLRAEGGKVTTTAQSTSSTPQPDSPPSQAVQDARAEYVTAQNAAGPNTPTAIAPAPAAAMAQTQPPGGTNDTNAQQPSVVARWPDASMATASPAPQPAPAPSDPRPNTKQAASPAPLALAAADTPTDKPTGSLPTLLLVIGGALALAGILASLIYRFAGGRGRVQAGDRRVNWDDREPQDQRASRAPWLDATPRAQQPQPVDFDAVRPRAAQRAAIDREIKIDHQTKAVEAHAASAHAVEAVPDAAGIETFDGEFEIEAASSPQLAANHVHDEAPADRDEHAHNEAAVDVDIITAMLERLLNEGPRLSPPSPEAGFADFAQSRRGPSAARA